MDKKLAEVLQDSAAKIIACRMAREALESKEMEKLAWEATQPGTQTDLSNQIGTAFNNIMQQINTMVESPQTMQHIMSKIQNLWQGAQQKATEIGGTQPQETAPGGQPQPSPATQTQGNENQQAATGEEAAEQGQQAQQNQVALGQLEQALGHVVGILTQNQEAASTYPEAYQELRTLQNYIKTQLGVNIFDAMDIERIDQAIAGLPEQVQQIVMQTINNSNQKIVEDLTQLRSGQGNVQQLATHLKRYVGRPVNFNEPASGRRMQGVLERIMPNSITISMGNENRTYNINDQGYEELMQSIQPQGIGERINPLNWLKTYFQSAEQEELIKLAMKLDIMGYEKHADNITKLAQKI